MVDAERTMQDYADDANRTALRSPGAQAKSRNGLRAGLGYERREAVDGISGPRQGYDDDTTVNQKVMAMVMMTVVIDRYGCVGS
jgi:hypothetical protein